MNTEKFDQKFDNGENITAYLDVSQAMRRLAASNTWHSCSRCIYFLPGYPVSSCNALMVLPRNTTTENDCSEFWGRNRANPESNL